MSDDKRIENIVSALSSIPKELLNKVIEKLSGQKDFFDPTNTAPDKQVEEAAPEKLVENPGSVIDSVEGASPEEVAKVAAGEAIAGMPERASDVSPETNEPNPTPESLNLKVAVLSSRLDYLETALKQHFPRVF